MGFWLFQSTIPRYHYVSAYVMEAPYITHRIIAKGDWDPSPAITSWRDHRGGTLVTKERIGKVLTIHGQPIIIPFG